MAPLCLGYDTRMTEFVAGFDIGGTKISLVIAELGGDPIGRFVEQTKAAPGRIEIGSDQITCHGLSEQLKRMLCGASDECELHRAHLKAIGIVSAGPIRDGELWCPPNICREEVAALHRELPWSIPLVAPLHAAFSCPVDLMNDCSGAVLGEVYAGVGKNATGKASLHVAYATISTGFGVGAWDGGRLILGKDGNAGEFGHIVVERDGRVCGCGNRGCVEAYASGTGVVGNARTRLVAMASGKGLPIIWHSLLALEGTASDAPVIILDEAFAKLTPAVVFEAAAQGDPTAAEVVADLIYAAGIGLSAVANAYDPEVITIGGGIALAHPELIEPIRDEMLRHLNVVPPEVRLTTLGHRVTELGAVAIARQLADR